MSSVTPTPTTPSHLNQGNAALRQGDTTSAIRHYLKALDQTPGLASTITANLALARRKYRAQRSSAAKPSVAVCGWELAHNPAGRVYTLAMLYETFADVEIIGSLFPKWGRDVWEPLRDTPIAKHSFVVEDEAKFIDQAIQLVAAHPYDIVHLSKPRAPNIFFGMLYKLIWDAKVLMDIDDEELAFVGAETPISVDDYIQQHGNLPDLKDLAGKDWTRLAVGLAKEFDGVTVCNTPLQQRYGGEIIRHARDEKLFNPSPEFKRQSRDKYGLPQDKKVVLFFGTPREHKGLIETAQAIAELNRPDILFCIVGNFPDAGLKKRLQEVKGCPFVFLPNQPYKAAPEVVAMADCCVLMQDDKSLAAQFQTPAKLSDALGMELLVLAQATPPLMGAIGEGAIVPISLETLATTLASCLNNSEDSADIRQRGRLYFEKHLSLTAVHSKLPSIAQRPVQTSQPAQPLTSAPQLSLFNAIGGWQMFTPAEPIIKDHIPNSANVSASVPKLTTVLKKQTVASTPRGGVNGASGALVKGWLAVIGDFAPRKGMLKIADHTISFTADVNRDDLKKKGINGGKHAFQVQVPSALFDGKDHNVVLIDEETGLEISKKMCRWEKPQRNYWDFQGFLKSSMTQPEIQAPFQEADKRSFAMMECIANDLCRRAMKLSEKPLVTVVMPMFNRASVVTVSIASVLSQSYPYFELIVVDDGSTDNSVEVVRGIGDKRIRLIELGENRGVTIARNTALRAARGSIVAYLDSDNTWDERFLAAHVGALDHLPEADMIYSGVLLYIGNSTSPYAMRYGHLHVALLENKNYIDNNIIVHRSSFLAKLGYFDETLRRYVDWDLVLRATELGCVYSIPILLCHYYYGKTENAITDNPTHTTHLQILRENHNTRKKNYLQKIDKKDLIRPVSVIIPSWQALEDIRDCIEALCARDWKNMLNLIVVDNDSNDDVKNYLQNERVAGRIQLILLDANYGFTHAVNIGIERARLDSDIILLNNDAIALPGAIQALQQACLNRPDAGMTVPRQILPAGTKTLRTHVPFARETDDCDVNISAHHRNVADVPVFHDGGDLELSYAAFFAVYIRREVIDNIGVLDAEYGRHYRSDRVYSDMMRNLTKFRMFYAPNSHFIHKLQKSTDQLRDTGTKDSSFDLMFKRNQWDTKTAERLGYKFAAWDVF